MQSMGIGWRTVYSTELTEDFISCHSILWMFTVPPPQRPACCRGTGTFLTLYCKQQQAGATGQSKPIRDQDVVSTSGQSSKILPVLNSTSVSEAKLFLVLRSRRRVTRWTPGGSWTRLYTALSLPSVPNIKEVQIFDQTVDTSLFWNAHLYPIGQSSSKRISKTRSPSPLLEPVWCQDTLPLPIIVSPVSGSVDLFIFFPKKCKKKVDYYDWGFEGVYCHAFFFSSSFSVLLKKY